MYVIIIAVHSYLNLPEVLNDKLVKFMMYGILMTKHEHLFCCLCMYLVSNRFPVCGLLFSLKEEKYSYKINAGVCACM